MATHLFFIFFMFFPYQKVAIQAPDSVPLGSLMEISWDAVLNGRDFVTIVPQGEAEGAYDRYKYASHKSWKVTAPEKSGAYEIRYLGAESPYPTLARKPLQVTQVSARVTALETVVAGGQLPVTWEGPNNPSDFITIVPVGTAEGTYATYKYTNRGNPAQLIAPDESGDYEIRYATGGRYITLGRTKIKVTGANATLTAPDKVAAGSNFEVSWTGPNNPQDFITLVEKGAKEGVYGNYTYTKIGSPLTLPAPETPGDYELRYATGEGYKTLAISSLKIESVSASVTVPQRMSAGSAMEIPWTGPNNPTDYITIVVVGAPEGTYETYVYTHSENPARLLVPEKPGKYEVRYLTGRQGKTLASAPFRVIAVSASLNAPAEAKAGSIFEVKWAGPNNPQDFIAIGLAGRPDLDWKTYTYTHGGNPSEMRAPLTPGDYELRYTTGQKYIVLARESIQVTPPDVAPGKLKVVLANGGAYPMAQGFALELILDASGSMLQRLDGKRRIDIAKSVLIDLVENQLPTNTLIALRVFGHREADSCRTDLELPLGPLRKGETAALIGKIQAKNLAKTPIAASLNQVSNDLAGVSGQRLVVLITDGEETCGGDSATTIKRLRDSGMDVRVNIVGFAIDDSDLKRTFKLWADLGDGDYFDASGANQLSQSLARALQVPFDVLNEAGQKVAEGLVGGEPIEVPAGQYRIKTRENPARTVADITVPSGGIKTVTLP